MSTIITDEAQLRRLISDAIQSAISDRRSVPSAPLAVDVERAAALLSLSRGGLYKLINNGEIPTIRIGKSRRVTTAALQAYVERLQASSGSA